jgi:small ligand-binding sensory domain FIST
VQLHLRDAETSSEDVEQMMREYAEQSSAARPSASLMFSCLGRGAALYGRRDHDTEVLRRHLGDIPVGGFFCNGEIGAVGGRSFLHGYTSSFGMIRAAARA